MGDGPAQAAGDLSALLFRFRRWRPPPPLPWGAILGSIAAPTGLQELRPLPLPCEQFRFVAPESTLSAGFIRSKRTRGLVALLSGALYSSAYWKSSRVSRN